MEIKTGKNSEKFFRMLVEAQAAAVLLFNSTFIFLHKLPLFMEEDQVHIFQYYSLEHNKR
jgi:hypothetical protein